MGEPVGERRRYPRVRVRAPLFARVLPQSEALGAAGVVDGVLLDASRGGVALAAHDPLAVGDLVELSVERRDRAGVVAHVDARVVAVEDDPTHDVVVRCAFAEPSADELWIERLLEAVASTD